MKYMYYCMILKFNARGKNCKKLDINLLFVIFIDFGLFLYDIFIRINDYFFYILKLAQVNITFLLSRILILT